MDSFEVASQQGVKKHKVEGYARRSGHLLVFFPIQLATIGVRATVGGNLIGDAALCAAYASAKVPTFPPVSSVAMPICHTGRGTFC